MTNNWIPTWLGVGWCVVYLLVLGLHVTHLAGTPRRAQAWHAAHILMALGMLDMYWPSTTGMPVGETAGEIVFGLALLGVLVLIGLDLRRGVPASSVWVVTAVGLVGMVVMFRAMSESLTLLSYALIVWFTAEAAGWATGYLSPAAVHPAEDRPDVVATGDGTVAVVATTNASALVTRASLVAMSLGMAYMFLAIQAGTSAGGMNMPGMS